MNALPSAVSPTRTKRLSSVLLIRSTMPRFSSPSTTTFTLALLRRMCRERSRWYMGPKRASASRTVNWG